MLISDCDYISNSQTNLLKKSKTIKSFDAYTNTNNMNNNLKDQGNGDVSGPEILKMKKQIEINENSNRNSNLNREHYRDYNLNMEYN
jgi:hypothetical protein